MAARQAGCAHTTIARTAARDAGFAAQLAEAENEAARDALRPPRGAEAEAKLGRTAARIARQGAETGFPAQAPRDIRRIGPFDPGAAYCRGARVNWEQAGEATWCTNRLDSQS